MCGVFRLVERRLISSVSSLTPTPLPICTQPFLPPTDLLHSLIFLPSSLSPPPHPPFTASLAELNLWGFPTHRYEQIRTNRLGSAATVWIVGNVIHGSLASTGAFELVLDGRTVSIGGNGWLLVWL
ncbi:unnamed protein product, partial [Closterium sp. NIES-53]